MDNLEDELAKALNLVNEADAAVDKATERVKAAKSAAVKLQKATYKAERKFKIENEALTEKIRLAAAADAAYRATAKAVSLARKEKNN